MREEFIAKTKRFCFGLHPATEGRRLPIGRVCFSRSHPQANCPMMQPETPQASAAPAAGAEGPRVRAELTLSSSNRGGSGGCCHAGEQVSLAAAITPLYARASLRRDSSASVRPDRRHFKPSRLESLWSGPLSGKRAAAETEMTEIPEILQ